MGAYELSLLTLIGINVLLALDFYRASFETPAGAGSSG